MPKRWDDFASIRRAQIEAGMDLTFSKVCLPYYINLVKELRPESLIEVGCGTGHLSENLINHVNTVVAIEPSEGMHAVAKQVIEGSGVQLFRLRAEGYRSTQPFDLIISHMVLQLVDNLELFIESVAQFMVFCQKRRESIRKDTPELDDEQVEAKLKEQWGQLDEEQKSKFIPMGVDVQHISELIPAQASVGQ